MSKTIKASGWPLSRIYGGSDDSLISDVSYFPNERCGKGRLEEDEIVSIVDYAKNILVGLCLYLKTLPPGSSHQSEWKKNPNRKATADHRAISSEVEVCKVSCQFTLTDEEIRAIEYEKVLKCTGREMPWHRRRGAWCRQKGFGHIPGFPRTKWRRPTWVRIDRMQEGQLQGGSTTIVK